MRRQLVVAASLFVASTCIGAAVVLFSLSRPVVASVSECLCGAILLAITGITFGLFRRLIRPRNQPPDWTRFFQRKQLTGWCWFGLMNLSLAGSLLIAQGLILAVCGPSWSVLILTAGVIAAVGILIIGVCPDTRLASLIVTLQPRTPFRFDIENVLDAVLLFERQRLTERRDSSQAKPLLEQVRDSLDAESNGGTTCGVWVPSALPNGPESFASYALEELKRRGKALIAPVLVSGCVTTLMLNLLPATAQSFAPSTLGSPDNREVAANKNAMGKTVSDQNPSGSQTLGPRLAPSAQGSQQSGSQQSGSQQSGSQQSGSQQSGSQQSGSQQSGSQQSG
ncbi:MAG: hypothetical protein ACKV2Q_09025, partial [Planctomycetaceae bacterium]